MNTNPHDYDAIVYCLGTSRFHIDTLNAMRRCHGIVWTHDANLMGLYLEWAERLQWELKFGWRGERDERSVDAILRDEARSTYGDRGRSLTCRSPPRRTCPSFERSRCSRQRP